MLIGLFSPNILSGNFGLEIGSRTFIPLLEALIQPQPKSNPYQNPTPILNIGCSFSSVAQLSPSLFFRNVILLGSGMFVCERDIFVLLHEIFCKDCFIAGGPSFPKNIYDM